MLLIALSSVCSLLLPTLMSDILNRGIYLPDLEDIFFCCVKMLPVTLISLAAIPGVNYFSALLANRRLLILDKATSNVDTRTEMLLQKAMDKLMRGRTCFAIAHGLSVVVDADRILVINDGQIVRPAPIAPFWSKRAFTTGFTPASTPCKPRKKPAGRTPLRGGVPPALRYSKRLICCGCLISISCR